MRKGFDSDFELEILAGAAKDTSYRKGVRRVLLGHDCWSVDSHRSIWEIVERLGDGDVLTGAIVARAIDGVDDDEAEEVVSTAKTVLKLSPKAKHYAMRELNEWVRTSRMKAAMGEAIKLLGDGKVEAAEDALRGSARSSTLAAYDAGDWFEGFDSRMAERERLRTEPDLRPVVPTRIPSLDKVINGGLRVTQLGLIVGHTGRGKSAFATHLAFYSAAASHPTIYISTEMNRDLIDTRFDSKMYGKPLGDFTSSRFTKAELDVFADKRERLKKRLATKLRTVSVPVRTLTKGMIEEILDEYERDHGVPVRTLLVDSPDHMLPPPRLEHRHQQASNYWDIKQVVEERSLAGWATTQAPKDYVAKLITAEGTADSYDKARISDLMVTLNQTPSEKKMGIVRAYVAKNRSGEMGSIIHIATDFARMHIEETEAPSTAPEPE